MRGQARQTLQPLVHGQTEQIVDANAAFERLQVAANEGLQVSIERRSASHNEDVARFRLQSQDDLERG